MQSFATGFLISDGISSCVAVLHSGFFAFLFVMPLWADSLIQRGQETASNNYETMVPIRSHVVANVFFVAVVRPIVSFVVIAFRVTFSRNS